MSGLAPTHHSLTNTLWKSVINAIPSSCHQAVLGFVKSIEIKPPIFLSTNPGQFPKSSHAVLVAQQRLYYSQKNLLDWLPYLLPDAERLDRQQRFFTTLIDLEYDSCSLELVVRAGIKKPSLKLGFFQPNNLY
jgi:hypothetical protein